MKQKMMDPKRYFAGSATNAQLGYFGTRKYGGPPVWPEAPKGHFLGRFLATESREALESRGWDVDGMLKEVRGS